MSQYYNAKRKRNIYEPDSTHPFKLSRSKLELYLECPKCFYIDRRLGIGRPPGYPFTLNSAVDALLKKEFDIYREKKEPHPLIKRYDVDAIPVPHEDLDIWRTNFKGIQFHHKPTNFIITGAIDDLWQNSRNEYIIVDYKSTSKADRIEVLDQEWHGSYKRQMEIYQWLLERNDYLVSKTGYFVYCNGDTSKETFDSKLEFELTLIPYEGNTSWVDGAITKAHECLNNDTVPESSPDCDYCSYINAISSI